VRADVLFKLVEDTASRSRSNVPAEYFSAEGPYAVRIELGGRNYRARVSFGAPLAVRVTQAGQIPVGRVLDTGQPIELTTTPASFGPVYYKRHDPTSSFYQLANMGDALSSGEFRTPAESPQYFLQLSLAARGESKTALLDPTAYIAGARHGMVRADQAETPVVLPAGGLNPGPTLLIDFSREESRRDNPLYSRDNDLSAEVIVRERIICMYELR
jgi:hypothetical protein